MAALSVSSRRLPGITQRNVLPIASIRCGVYNRPIELPHLETFPGAACWQPIELPCYKAAPLQAFGPLNPRRVCNSSVFLPHPSSSFKRSGVSGLFVVVLFLEFGPREYWGSEPVGTKVRDLSTAALQKSDFGKGAAHRNHAHRKDSNRFFISPMLDKFDRSRFL
jgi:hypothetical protein